MDGVGTTWLSGALRPDREMRPELKEAFQVLIDSGYEDFLQRVAEARKMDRDAVDRIARGRVWSGDDAKGLKLVDQLGSLDQAVAAAARRAKLADGYRVWYVEKEPTLKERLTASLLTSMAAWLGPAADEAPPGPGRDLDARPARARRRAGAVQRPTRDLRGLSVRGRIAAWLRAEWESVHGRPAASFSFEPFVVLVSAAVLLALLQFHGTAADLGPILAWLERGSGDLARAAGALYRGPWFELASYAFWSLACFVGYLVAPALLLRALRPGERLSSFGFSWTGLRGHERAYVLLFLATLPLVVLASTRPAFQETYPFYRLAGRSALDFLAWEAMYALQFVSLEFFFRGFLLHTLKRDLGAHAIFVATVPYCMIHFQKPLPEALGAVVAGIVLGTLSLRTGSVLGGAAVHVAVAVTMDVLALAQKAG